MKAAVLKGIENIKIVEAAVPKCGRGQVLVKVEACGICRTDMKAYYYGQRDLHLPRILGHEITGIVEKTGSGVTQVKTGDRVQIAPGLPCGCCRYCLRGWHQLCDSVQIMGFHYDGGFAEYVLVPANGVNHGVLNRIPVSLSFAEAALTEPLACSVSMQEAVRVGLGDTVVIFGAGPLGILNAKLAKARGAGEIILIEINEARLDAAAKKEFDRCVNGLRDDPVKQVLEITGGSGADVVIPCCPSPAAFCDGLAMLAKRGRFGFFSGLLIDSQPFSVEYNLIHYRELSVHGAYGCSAEHNRTAMELLENGVIKVKDMITRSIPLDEVLSGLKMVADMQETKIVIGN